MKYSKILLSAMAVATLTFSGCGGGGGTTTPQAGGGGGGTTSTLAGDITSDTTLTADKTWILDGLVAVKNGATLTIEPGTTIAGKDGTGAATSYMIVDKGSKIMAEGTAAKPIIFTSKKAVDGEAGAVGQWGGLTIVGNAGNAQVDPYEVNEDFVAGTSNMADNSGVLTHVKILNSGITMQKDKEINGLSLVGVGSGTKIEHITIDKSDDDGVEIWGGTVNLTDVKITNCTDDYFDIDDGYSGTVRGLDVVTTTGNAGIEMSGNTHATFDGFNITIGADQGKEGGIYFKKDGIGGTFMNGIVTSNATNGSKTIHSKDTADIANTRFRNVILAGSAKGFDGDSATALEAKFNAGLLTSDTVTAQPTQTLSGDITTDTTLTNDKIWIIDGLVAVKGATLTIDAGTIIAGKDGTGSSTSYMVVDKDATIVADGTEAAPIIFTSTKSAIDYKGGSVGQWGGLTIIGNDGNAQVDPYEVNEDFVAGTSGATNPSVLKHVSILNSGITMQKDKEINGLSFVGVGSEVTVEDLTIDNSDDDGVEIWGGSVNFTNVKITNCTDDYFDIDDGYSGTVTGLNVVTTTGNAGIEMSGNTAATFNDFNITISANQGKEGGIYFKKDGIGGHFNNGTVTSNATNGSKTIHSKDTADTANISFTGVTLAGSAKGFSGDSAAAIEAVFDSDATNTK